MIISVTQEDIDQGIKDVCERCPVALALQRQIENLDSCRVYHHVVILYFKNTGLSKRIQWSSKVMNFINLFDDGFAVKPFSFELSL